MTNKGPRSTSGIEFLDDAIEAYYKQSHLCDNCGIQTLRTRCDVCESMFQAISTPYFTVLHEQWIRENEELLSAKRRMLGPEGRV